MEWKDKEGKTYKISYSQKLQEQQLLVNKLLLICIILMILMVAFGGAYAYMLVQRVDALDPLAILEAVTCQ